MLLRRIGGLATLGFRQKFSKTVILMRVGARYHDVVHHQVDLSSFLSPTTTTP